MSLKGINTGKGEKSSYIVLNCVKEEGKGLKQANAQPQETNVTLRYLLSPSFLADGQFPVPVDWFVH